MTPPAGLDGHSDDRAKSARMTPPRMTPSQMGRLAGMVGVSLGLALGTAFGSFTLATDLVPYVGLPDVGRWLDWLRRIVEWLKLGGIALALLASATFIFTWALSYLRRASSASKPLLGYLALVTSYAPVGLTILASLGTVVPTLAPFVLKAFALAIVLGAMSWALAVIALVVGGDQNDLRRARKALIFAGTPWYTLALWIATRL